MDLISCNSLMLLNVHQHEHNLKANSVIINKIHNYVKYMCIRAWLQSVKFNLIVRTRKLDLILLFQTARINIGVFEGAKP